MTGVSVAPSELFWSRVARPLLLFVPLALASATFIWRGRSRYGPPMFGGEEPAGSHRAALHVLRDGSVGQQDYPPGFAYFVSLIYAVLPDDPRAVIAVQVVLLVVVQSMMIALTARLCGPGVGRTATVLVSAYFPFAYFSVVFNGVFIGLVLATAALLSLVVASEKFSLSRVAGAAALGAALTVIRPDYLLWTPAATCIVWLRQGVRRGIATTTVVVAFALAALLASNALNPPKAGRWMHGSHYTARALFLGTYQFEGRLWDWGFVLESSAPQDVAARAALAKLEDEVGAPFGSEKLEEATRARAQERMLEKPGEAFKKLILGSFRFWIFVPQQFEGGIAAWICTGLELGLFVLALAGTWILFRRSRPTFWLLLACGAAATATHAPLYIEARHSLPGRAVEIIAATAALAWIFGAIQIRAGRRDT